MTALLIALAGLLGAALAVVVVRHAQYSAQYRYTADAVSNARADAAKRSRAVRSGKSAEHLAFLLPQFSARFDLRDARFIGDPIDYVVFDGLQDGELRGVTFVEIKTGKSGLNNNQRCVRRGLGSVPVGFEVMRIDSAEMPRSVSA